MSDQGDLTSSQIKVMQKLLPQVKQLAENGMTEKQIVNSLVLIEGWPIGAVLQALKEHHPKEQDISDNNDLPENPVIKAPHQIPRA